VSRNCGLIKRPDLDPQGERTAVRPDPTCSSPGRAQTVLPDAAILGTSPKETTFDVPGDITLDEREGQERWTDVEQSNVDFWCSRFLGVLGQRAASRAILRGRPVLESERLSHAANASTDANGGPELLTSRMVAPS